MRAQARMASTRMSIIMTNITTKEHLLLASKAKDAVGILRKTLRLSVISP